MGTGSYGGGGGGGGGGSGGGGAGGVSTIGSRITAKEAMKVVGERLDSARKSPEYFDRQVGGPLVDSVYRELFRFHECLRQQDRAGALLKAFKIDGGKAFLRRLSDHLMDKYENREPDIRLQGTVRRTLEEFFLVAVKSDAELFVRGTCKQVAKGIDQNVMKRMSGYFLSVLLWEIVMRESEPVDAASEPKLKLMTERIANEVIKEFEKKFEADGRVPYEALYTEIDNDDQWFKKVISKCVSAVK